MAGDWIPMRLDLCEDPAVLQMADILGESDEYVVGCLHRVWSWASRNCHDGTVTGVTKMSLSRAVKLPKVVDAMCSVGWLIEGKTSDGASFIVFPKWENWLSKSAKSRLQNAMNQRISRESKKTQPVKQNPEPPKPVTNPSLSDSDKTVTTGEKSTGEESKEEKPPLPPKGEPSKPPKRKPKTTQGQWIIPQGMNQDRILEALGHFEEMRKSKGKPIANRENLSRIFPSFDDEAHLLYAITFATANEYQGIKVDYRPPLQPGKPIKRESDLPKIDANWEPA